MPKVTKHPRLRAKTYKGASGQIHVYYVYDMRQEGVPDIRLGKDFAHAVERWDELHNHKPRTIGRLQEAFDRWRQKELPKYDSAETAKGYAKNLGKLEPVFGQMAWDEIDLPILRRYLDLRTAKTQGNREMTLLALIWGKAVLWGMTRHPWPAAGVKNWKNAESAREFEVTDELFAAVYAEGDQVLRDCMDIATATGMRLTDARQVLMPAGGMLHFRSGKAGKRAFFEVASSPVLSELVKRREKSPGNCLMLLATGTGHEVSARMLRTRWDEARERAADKAAKTGNPGLARAIRAMYLRDMRSRAADLAGDVAEASKLLQHSSKRLTEKHYRTRAEKLRAVR
ncbi:MAG: hypothetical protein WC023_06260 [Rhodocyclaceae bacterium]